MTSSDDDLGWVLRRELNAEAARLSPAQDGLSQIRAQLGSRPAVPVVGPLWGGLRVDAERLGLHARHLAAEAADWFVGTTRAIPFLRGRDRAENEPGARPGIGWLRPVLALAAVCIFAGTAAAVPGLRHAITSIGSSGSGSTTSVTGKGGGSLQGTGGHQQPGSGNGVPGASNGASGTASPSPSATCTSLAKPVPSVKATPSSSGGSAVSPAVSPAQSSPAVTPTTEPASPTQTPTTSGGSPTPTDTSGAPLGGGGSPPAESTHLTQTKPCQGPTLKGSAAAAAAGAAQIPPLIPTPDQTSAQVEQPAVTPATPATSSAATPSSAGDSGDAATPTPTSTSSSDDSGSPWSNGFASAHACWHHSRAGCPGS